jgi:energy-coupling factor transport system permease protein
MSQAWKVRDAIVAAMLSVVLGLLLTAWSALYIPASPVLGPVGIEILYGLYFLPAVLVAYLIRKPGVAVFAGLLSALVEALMNPAFGIVNILLAGLIQGAATELIFALGGYKRWRLPIVLLAGLLPAPAIFVRDYFAFGYAANPAGVLVAMIAVRCGSGLLLGGLLSKLIGDGLVATGALRNFASGQAAAAGKTATK